MGEFRMPSLGADMEEGTLVQWMVKPGDRVKRGDIIAIVHTEKADIEVEVFETGVVDRLLAEPGTKLPVGAVLAILKTEEAALPATTVPAAAPPITAGGTRSRISPLARQAARELGVDLATVQGTGPHGAIERADVERAAAAAKTPAAKIPAAAPGPPAEPIGAGEAYRGMRHAIAAAMARSNREIPHYYLETQIDMTSALRWLEAANLKRPVQQRLLPAALLLKAVARSLADVPELNGYWIDDRHQPHEAVHIGFAISLRQGGLVVPAILHADRKSLDELMAAMSDLIQRARAGRLRSSEITDGTITVTNLGDRGVETVYGVIYPPQVALVGFGRVTERPWAENGMLGVRPVLTATLAGDHRATDGRRGAQFLECLTRWLQQPEKL
jgi:pyruvate dehydrogenase E2 component (dihydrolipoyllysine-residue acetyltransferase)